MNVTIVKKIRSRDERGQGLDLQLPRVSGYEITREMWFNLSDTGISIIAPDQEAAAIYENKGGVDHVLKSRFCWMN